MNDVKKDWVLKNLKKLVACSSSITIIFTKDWWKQVLVFEANHGECCRYPWVVSAYEKSNHMADLPYTNDDMVSMITENIIHCRLKDIIFFSRMIKGGKA